MKNLLSSFLLCAFLLVFSTKSNGQAALLVLIFGEKAATENFHFSLDGGINYTSVSNFAGDPKIGGNFGLGVYIKINDKWAFVPEFKPLSKKGEKEVEQFIPIPDNIENLENLESRLRLSYLDIPLMIRYEASPLVYFAGGPQISFRTGAELFTEGSFSGDDTIVEVTNDLTDQTNWIDLGISMEVGFHLRQEKVKTMDLKLRWSPGFVNIAKEELNESTLLNNTWQFIVSFPFLKSTD